MTDWDNIDAGEIAKFESMAAYWWDTNGVLKSLHDINPLRLKYIDDRSPLYAKRVLDVGCGGGILAEAMARKGARVKGIDMAEGPLQAARDHAAWGGFEIGYRQSTAEAFSRKHANEFDIVTCFELLEHVENPTSIVAACARLVRPGGDVFFATLDRNLIAGLFAIIGAEYVLRLIARGTHQYRRFVKATELKHLAGEAGLTCRNLTWMNYNPFTKRYFLGKTGRVNYLIHFTKSF
ncbi:MAG: bifunctional 2-polyprenyl-6-hydroxyphenol methylase/3-demethylubiquinol 3-O-methyltransferase UbiG [Desulfobacterales bacterium]|jgi:2-polyprenyl-6-hydroxyphenyl methylase/3-demethylubiquinone-9 3-methyltransferase|nr:bifunctional 2-polyprenyl-6-hydroxyphenol methylase/3-demethylubiquinol 3-O-methyltransferase UbiG [Desulfobacterales bacterium]